MTKNANIATHITRAGIMLIAIAQHNLGAVNWNCQFQWLERSWIQVWLLRALSSSQTATYTSRFWRWLLYVFHQELKRVQFHLARAVWSQHSVLARGSSERSSSPTIKNIYSYHLLSKCTEDPEPLPTRPALTAQRFTTAPHQRMVQMQSYCHSTSCKRYQ